MLRWLLIGGIKFVLRDSLSHIPFFRASDQITDVRMYAKMIIYIFFLLQMAVY
jgi:hypothetical protein